MNNNINQTRYILWTGGFDSTFMFLKFARDNLIIKPIYVIDPCRKSLIYELEAMQSILYLLKTKYSKDVRADILDIDFYHLNDIAPNDTLHSFYKDLSKSISIGSQYEWLSRLAMMYPFLDLGVEKHIYGTGGCTTAIQNDGGFLIENGIGRLNTSKSSNATIALFGRFRFPIITYTGLDMLSIVESWGWEEIIKKAWFCHDPLDGMPCGMCRPCQQKMEDCMVELLPVSAQKRYKLFSITKKFFGAYFAQKASYLLYRKLWRNTL